MTRRDIRILLIGGFAGAAIGIGLYWFAVRPGRGTHPAQSTSTVATATAAQVTSGNEGAPASVQLSPDEEKSIALESAEVAHRQISSEVATVGKVDEPETRLATISARIGGRIEKLHLQFTGQPVAKGQPVADIYSPELLNAAEEYRLAIENGQRLAGASQPEAVKQADELVAASRKRLELWGITPGQIEQLATNPNAAARLTTYASTYGVVVERKVTEGQYVNTGEALYSVADLSTVWVKLDVYEADLKQVRVGDAVEMTSEGVQGKLRGHIDFIDTTVNHDTRTASLRVQVPNPGMRLRPGMYVRATIFGTPQHALVVPRSAVIDTGTRSIVYVARGNGIFESREIKAGPAVADVVPVLSGLSHGERVVTQGSFLVDSQTRISGGMTSAFGGSKEFAGAAKSDQNGTATSSVKVQLKVSPDAPQAGTPAMFEVQLTDAAGQDIPDAQVQAQVVMPAMPAMNMPEMRASADLKRSGNGYRGHVTVPMAGAWNITITASRNGALIGTYKTRLDAR